MKNLDGSGSTTKLSLPSIHLNGSGKKALVEQNRACIRTVEAALNALRDAHPHGRDYYPQGPDALGKAVRESLARIMALEKVYEELTVIQEYLGDYE